MARHDDGVRLRHMLDHAREAIALANSRSRSDLERDRVLQLALTRLVEVVGEAAARVSDAAQSRCPEVPWPQVIGMRNRLVHGYDSVDLEVLWQTAIEDLPALVSALERCVAAEPALGARDSGTASRGPTG